MKNTFLVGLGGFIGSALRYLRAGIVAARREGKWMHYRLKLPAETHAARILKSVRDYLVDNSQMQSDRSRLVRLCCSPSVPVQLKRAPKPSGVAPLETGGK